MRLPIERPFGPDWRKGTRFDHKEWGRIPFDASVIATLGKTLPEDLKMRLRLSVLVYGSMDRLLLVPR